MTNGPAIEVSGVVKRFGKVLALDGVDLIARHGEVVALLGPNGAGKTTLVRVLATLPKPDAGDARVLGLDVQRCAAELRARIRLAGQYAAVDENLTGLENLTMVGRLYGAPRAAAKARGRELLERFDLVEAASRPTKTYSAGMRLIAKFVRAASAADQQPAAACVTEDAVFELPGGRRLPNGTRRSARLRGSAR